MTHTNSTPESPADHSPPKRQGHVYDDEGICVHCGLDGVEASWYSKRGYAHEYPEYFEPCRKRPQESTDEL